MYPFSRSSENNFERGEYHRRMIPPRESHHRLPRRRSPSLSSSLSPPDRPRKWSKEHGASRGNKWGKGWGGEKKGDICPGRKENEEGVDGFIWSGELANCSTIEERISRRIREVGRIANSAVASLSRSLANIPSIFLRSSCLCDLQSLRLAHTYTNTKVYT